MYDTAANIGFLSTI